MNLYWNSLPLAFRRIGLHGLTSYIEANVCLHLTNMKHFHTVITLSTLALPQQNTMVVKGKSNPIIYHGYLGRRRRHAFQNPWGLSTTPKHQHRHTRFSWRHQRIDQCPWCHQGSTDENTQPMSGGLSLVQKKVPKEKVIRARRLALGGMKVSEDAVAESGSWSEIALPELQDGVSMVTSIQVDNLAMVDSVKVKLGRGLIAITGETGTGKSLISSAFSLAAGARVRGGDLVGSNGPTARVQLELELANEHVKTTSDVLDRLGVPVADDGRKLSVTRIISGKGSTATVNGCSVKVGSLRDLMAPLIYTVDANGVELFSRADGRLRLLDRMLDPVGIALVEKVRRVVSELKEAEACRTRLEHRCRFEGSPGGEEDASLLHHWVEELDQFEQDEMRFMDRMRTIVDDFINDWGEAMLGPLAEPFRSERTTDDASDTIHLVELWLGLAKIRDAMHDLEASRTKVDLAWQTAVHQSNPDSIAHALGKIRDLLIDAEAENVGLNQDLLQETHEDLNTLEDCLKSAGEKLERAVQGLPKLPITLEEVEERISKWKDLSRKHAVLPERLGSIQAQLRAELDELVVAAEALPLAREREAHWRVLAEQATNELSAIRRRKALEVEELINPIMGDVGLQGATIKVVVEQAKSLGPTGADRVQFVMDANRGQTKGPVDVVASSGEKSRLLLLLETRLPPPQARSSAELERRALDIDTEMGRDSVNAGNIVSSRGSLVATDDAVENGVTRASPCAVLYDEIDAHVGGRTAVAVGRLLANQGRRSQVVVVTHTASVAALADQHLVVEKHSPDSLKDLVAPSDTVDSTLEGQNSTSLRRSRYQTLGYDGISVAIREVQGRDREEEVGRMAAGDIGGGAASDLAREMLQYSRQQRSAA